MHREMTFHLRFPRRGNIMDTLKQRYLFCFLSDNVHVELQLSVVITAQHPLASIQVTEIQA